MPVPGKARLAAACFLASAAVVLATAWLASGAEAASVTLGRPVLRGLGLIAIAWGLLRGASWSWLVGVVFPGVWLLMGVVGVGSVLASEGGPSPSAWIGVAAILAPLALGWGLLMAPSVRRRYRSGS